jgi:hypothetical protein
VTGDGQEAYAQMLSSSPAAVAFRRFPPLQRSEAQKAEAANQNYNPQRDEKNSVACHVSNLFGSVLLFKSTKVFSKPDRQAGHEAEARP